jgi:hypothetical protein
MAATVHIRKETQWKSICADEIDYQIFKGSFYQVKKGDWISVNGVWQQILCPVVNAPWGFDMVNREIQIINSFPTIKFRHKVVFENSDDTYDYANDPFVIRTTVNAQVGFPDGDKRFCGEWIFEKRLVLETGTILNTLMVLYGKTQIL